MHFNVQILKTQGRSWQPSGNAQLPAGHEFFLIWGKDLTLIPVCPWGWLQAPCFSYSSSKSLLLDCPKGSGKGCADALRRIIIYCLLWPLKLAFIWALLHQATKMMDLSIWCKCLLARNIHMVCFFPIWSRNRRWNRGQFYCSCSQVLLLSQTALHPKDALFCFLSEICSQVLSFPCLTSWCCSLTAKILPLPKTFLTCLCVICVLEAVPWFELLDPTRWFWLHLSFRWDEALLSCKKVSATKCLQVQVLLRVTLTSNQQGLLICIGGEFELLTYLCWQKFNFQVYCPFLSYPILCPFHLTHLPLSFLTSFLQKQPLSAHPTPCKQPGALEGALEALAQPVHLPSGHPWSNHPPHLPPLPPLLPPFTHSPPPHLCQDVYLLYILLIFVSNPSVNRLPHCRAQCCRLNTFSPPMKPY